MNTNKRTVLTSLLSFAMIVTSSLIAPPQAQAQVSCDNYQTYEQIERKRQSLRSRIDMLDYGRLALIEQYRQGEITDIWNQVIALRSERERLRGVLRYIDGVCFRRGNPDAYSDLSVPGWYGPSVGL